MHVVAHPGKHPKQIARDVQSIALASFGLELDRRIISVVQLGGDVLDSQMLLAHPRPSVVAITAEANGLRSLVRVTLARDDENRSVSPRADRHDRATGWLPQQPSARCVSSTRGRVHRRRQRVIMRDAHDIAVVTVVIVTPPSEQLVSGSAIVRPQQENGAIALVLGAPTGGWRISP